MAKVLVLLLAFVASLLVGTLVVQVIAEWARGNEVFIIAYFWVVLAALAAIAVFAVTLAAAGTAQAVDRAAGLMACLLALLAAVAAGYGAASGGLATLRADAPVLASLVLSGFAVILVQWALVRRRAARRAEALP